MSEHGSGIIAGEQISDSVAGAVGHFVGAVLETAGIFGQHQILENFADLINSFGAFVYVWCLVGAVFSVAIFGAYRNAAYLLIGPALFYWMLTPHAKGIYGTAHRYGSREETSTQKQIDFIKELRDHTKEDVDRFENGAKVSWFFVSYDNLVSNVVQNVVELLVDTENYDDLMFVARERVYMNLLRAHGKDQNFKKLISISLLGTCAKQIAIAKELAEPRFHRKTIPATTFNEYNRLYKTFNNLKTRTVKFPDDLRKYADVLDGESETPPKEFSCETIWKYTRIAALAKAEEYFKRPDPRHRSQFQKEHAHLFQTDDEEKRFWARVYESVLAKLTPDKPEGSTGATRDYAKAFDVFAAFFLRNSISQTAHAKMTTRLAGREEWQPQLYGKAFGNVPYSLSIANRLKITTFAGSIYYIQGLFLYVLAMAFPFFCIFLLMPSRAETFFVWMGLWLWVKSWDAGFAFVYMIRDMFWNLTPNAGGFRVDRNFTDVEWDKDPVAILNVMYVGDPTSTMNTYYTIIAILTISVPLLTAHLCLGASGLYKVFKGTFEDMPERFFNDNANAQTRDWATYRDMAQSMLNHKPGVIAAEEAGKNAGITGTGAAGLMAPPDVQRERNEAKWDRDITEKYFDESTDSWRSRTVSDQDLSKDQIKALNKGLGDSAKYYQRSLSGDGAVARNANVEGSLAKATAAWSPEIVRRNQELAMYTGRHMFYGQVNAANYLVNAFANYAAEHYEVGGSSRHGDPYILGGLSKQASNSDTTIGPGATMMGPTEGAGENAADTSDN